MTHSLTDSLTHSLTDSLTDTLTDSLIDSLLGSGIYEDFCDLKEAVIVLLTFTDGPQIANENDVVDTLQKFSNQEVSAVANSVLTHY